MKKNRLAKSLILEGIMFLFTLSLFAQSAIFLHHSTGGNVYAEGNVASYISNYNSLHGTSLSLTERAYPNTPWPWANYPYDYWKLWIGGSCNSTDPNIECLATIAADYKLVIFKHCFPGAGIEADLGTPDVSSDRKSLENYKLQYRALRALMDSYPTTKFMVWTLTPLHRLATSADEASRASQFVNWVKNSWLTEDGNEHPNIIVFDFFSLIAELSPDPDSGQQYCLKYKYEGSHTGSDSHPNTAANQYVGPIFAQAVIDELLNSSVIHVDSIVITGQGGINAITSPGGSLQLTAQVFPSNSTNKMVDWSIASQSGASDVDSTGLVTALANGSPVINATARDGSGIYGSIVVNISGQAITANNTIDKSDFRIRLNQDELFIDSENSMPIKGIKIFNSNGILVFAKNVNSTKASIFLQSRVPGIYIVQVLDENSMHVFKVLKP
jgi:hypothetical protein